MATHATPPRPATTADAPLRGEHLRGEPLRGALLRRAGIAALLTLTPLATLLSSGCADEPSDALPDVVDDTGEIPPPVRGPGLGNVSFTEDELFAPVGWFNESTGVPERDDDFVVTLIKPFGTNVAYMHNGYLLSLFAPDSGGGPGGLVFFDVSDPRNPVLVNRVYDPHGITGSFREAHSIGFSNFDGRQHAAFHTGRGVEIWDLDNVHDPRPLSRLDLPGVNHGDYVNVAWQLFWQGDFLYVAGSTRGVYIVDVRDPLAPVLADRGGDRPNPVPLAELGGFRIGPIFAVGNLLVVSSMDDTGGFATLDISDPVNPTVLDARVRDLPRFYAICLGGDRIITSVRGSRARMSVWDISDPFRITLVDDRVVVDEQLYCTTQDEFIFQGAEPDAVKIDTSTPGAWEVVGRGRLDVPLADHGQVTAFGNLLFVGNDHGTGSALMPHQLEPDTRPPEVSMVHPADGATLQSVRSRVGVVFSDNVELHTVSPETFIVRPVGGEPVPGRYMAQGSILNFQPDAPLELATTYEVVIPAGGIEDWAGNATDAEFRSTFTTAAVAPGDAAAPRVDLQRPAPVTAATPVNLSAQLSGDGPFTISWSPGDGSGWTEPSDDPAFTWTYDEPGNYQVVVRVGNGRGWASATTRVTVVASLDTTTASVSSTLAYDEGRHRVYTANRDHGTVSALDIASASIAWETTVGETPRSVTLTATATPTVWVAVRDADALVELDPSDGTELRRISTGHGSRPVAVAADPNGAFVAASLEGTGELLLVRDGHEPTSVALGDNPGGLSVDPDGAVLVSRFQSPEPDAVVWRVTTTGGVPDGAPVAFTVPADTTTVDAEDRSRGVANYLGAPTPQPGTDAVWVPATLANVFRGSHRDGQRLTHESTVRAITVRLNGQTGAQPTPRLDLNDRALPTHVAFSPLGDWAWITLQGSNIITMIDAWTGATVGALTDVGSAPEAITISPDGRTAFVHAFLSRHVDVYDIGPLLDGTTADARRVARIRVSDNEPLSATVLRGKQVFYNAADPRMSMDGYIACASCHLDGGHDSLTWDFTDRGEGVRNTTDLRGRAGMGHGPIHWSANFDEIQDFEHVIRDSFGGTGFISPIQWNAGTRSQPLGDPKAGLSTDLDALAAYVASLTTFPRSPWRDASGALSDAAQRGAAAFDDAGCTSCHTRPAYTDSGSVGTMGPRHDVGTLTAASGQRLGGTLDGIDTPTLRGVWATAPYLHDGSAATLEDVFSSAAPDSAHDTSGLSADDRSDLLQYLLELE